MSFNFYAFMNFFKTPPFPVFQVYSILTRMDSLYDFSLFKFIELFCEIMYDVRECKFEKNVYSAALELNVL